MHKVNHHIELCSKIIVLCLLSIVLTTGIMLSSNITKAESSSANAAVTVPEACTMTSTNNTPHTATLSPNTASGSDYENGIGKTTLSVVCNDYNGFSIYAIGFTGNQYEGENHTKLVGSNTGNTISTAVYTNNTTPSNWSMKLTKITDSTESYNPANLTISTGYDAYHAVPDTYTKVAQYKANTGSSTTDTTLGVKLETTYAAFIASNQPADTYVGQVKYTMVHPYDDQPLQPQTTEAGCIRYYANGSNVEGTMGCQSISASATSATLLASNFSRQGYGFAGWSNKFDYATNPTQEGIKFYGPQEYITFIDGQYTGSNPGLSLYAVWVKSEGNLQDSSKVTTICNRLTRAPTDGTANLNSVSALTDQRDNETYAIAKLADGNCWMIENLRLESTTTHNSDGSLAQGYGTSATYGNFSGLADAESANFSDSTTANSLYYSGTQSGDATIDIDTTNNPGYRMPRYNNYNHKASSTDRPQNPTTNSATNNTTNAGMYSYGNYYTWSAALANTIHYNSPTATDADGKTSETVNTSLCPKGWKLPRGGNKSRETTNDFWSLIVAGINGGTNPANYDSSTIPIYTDYSGTPEGSDTSKKLRAYPNNFLYSGYFETSSTTGRGSDGRYWSSTASSNIDSYRTHLYSTRVDPGNGSNHKYSGYSIRCTVSPSA